MSKFGLVQQTVLILFVLTISASVFGNLPAADPAKAEMIKADLPVLPDEIAPPPILASDQHAPSASSAFLPRDRQVGFGVIGASLEIGRILNLLGSCHRT